MARITLPEGTDDESIRLLGLQPAMGNAMAVIADAIYAKSSLDSRVREAVRMRVAEINQCQLCLNTRFDDLQEKGINENFYQQVSVWRDSDVFNSKEKLALDYAERFAENHLSIDDAFMAMLAEHFSATEIYELTFTIAGLIANGRTLQVLQIDQHCKI
jgi:AhpD family alkylhydroperoxidase